MGAIGYTGLKYFRKLSRLQKLNARKFSSANYYNNEILWSEKKNSRARTRVLAEH